MKELVTHIVKAMVDEPEEVSVVEDTRDDGSPVLELRVAESDRGKVIGKKGRVAQAIRTVMAMSAHAGDQPTPRLDIVD